MPKRREFSPEYKAKLVMEVLREETTMSEIAFRENINIKQLSNWKTEFMENAARAFSRSRDDKAAARQIEDMKDIERAYQAKVGQLTLENDFLKEVYKKLHGQEWDPRIGGKG
jgi:Transposase and inactivated derivatives